MKTGRRKFYHRTHSTFELQLSAMVDVLTIILVFLLKSYSTSPVTVEMNKGLTLPTSTSQSEPIEALKMVVSKDGVFVEDQKVIELKEGVVATSDLDSGDQNAIRKLFEELEKHATKTREIASQNKTVEFDGKLLLQADQNLAYGTLKKVVYTAMLAGYGDLKLATISKE